jgi:Fe-S-cluster containining protein
MKASMRKAGPRQGTRPRNQAGGSISARTGNDGSERDDFARRRDVAGGLAYLHHRINATAGRTFDAASFLYALIEVLEEKNLFSRNELEQRKQTVAGRLMEKFRKHDGGVSVREQGRDADESACDVSIDCADRVALCGAACCKMVFPLSAKDVEENVIAWDFSAPYVIAKAADGYCRHLDRSGKVCTMHDCRPLPCRVYDCRNDSRIWRDFSARVINPKVRAPEWPSNLTAEELTGEQMP